jgi:hypothetical protein
MAKTLQDQIDEGFKPKPVNVKFSWLDHNDLAKAEEKHESLEKSVLNSLDSLKRGEKIHRIAVMEDPSNRNFQTLWKPKRNLLPDDVLKKISVQDSLVSAIWMARANHLTVFGRELQDRFSLGYILMPRKGVMEKATDSQKEELRSRIKNATKLLGTCGFTEGWSRGEQESLPVYLYKQAKNALINGRFATEIIYTRKMDGTRVFHAFRSVDAGTIYKTVPKLEAIDRIRQQALSHLQSIKNEKLQPERFQNDEYAYVEVIENQPRQAFTEDEMVVWDMYPVTDYELNGYPITPIDTVINDVVTHINITTYNKLYFQNGRAARGMIVIKSTDISPDLITQIRNHMTASINNVNNSFRVPVFGVDVEDEISWQPFEGQGARDMEFEYLYDNNARAILSAFQISPDELPGYSHLSKGTNNQALSESSNEYKMEAARDVGIRPLLLKFQDFFNEVIIPLIDPVLAQLCVLKFAGLDADTAEKESTRLAQDQQLHMDYDEIRLHVEKEPVGQEWGGRFPLNAAYQAVLDKYWTVGQIKEHFFGQVGASKDPKWDYVRDPFWFQYQQLLQAKEQMAQQQQQQQMQQQQMQQPPEGEGDQPPEGEGEGQPPEGESEIAQKADQVAQLLGGNNG